MTILGISCFYHDAAAALVVDGKIVFAIEEERLSRIKHDSSFPKRAVRACLEVGNIGMEDVDVIIFYEKPIPKFIRILESTLAHAPASHKVFAVAMQEWLGSKLWMKGILANELQCDPSRILFSKHHVSHAASAFFCSPFEEAAILTIDGVGESETTMLAHGKGAVIKPLSSIHFPNSLGLLYSVFTAFLGFEVNEGEYKVMGMAPYGSPKYLEKVERLIVRYEDGSFELKQEYFSFSQSLEHGYSKRFERLFGIPRTPESPFFTKSMGQKSQGMTSDYEDACKKNQYYADVAASIQRFVEEQVLLLVRHALRVTGSEYICLAGGVALNSTANGRIARESGAKGVFIQPSAGDAGGALGAALWASRVVFREISKTHFTTPYLGIGYAIEKIREAVGASGLSYREFQEKDLINEVAESLVGQQVIGFFHGRCEWGPRALGARSILADPRNSEAKDIVNTKIKFREPFRPFAPVVLDTHAHEFFEIENGEGSHLTPFMLMTVRVREDKKHLIPAVVHVDGSARVQVLTRDFNPRLYAIIERFYALTGVPVLLNTSFNVRGEPIVTSPEDAIRTFCASGLDLLVLENVVCTKLKSV